MANTQVSVIAPLKNMLSADSVKTRFNEVLGKRAPQFMGAILSLANNNQLLAKCEPTSVVNSALIAATLDLQINPSLNQAYVIPYGNTATFQIGTRGLIQLALRSGQYQKIEVNEVYEGEIRNFDKFTGDFERGDAISDKIIGFMAYIRLINGYEKYLYMTVDQLKAHGQKYSRNYNSSNSLWKTDFSSMSKKTLLKQILSKFGILSVEMQRAQIFDQSSPLGDAITDGVDALVPEYVDNPNSADAKKKNLESLIEDAEVINE